MSDDVHGDGDVPHEVARLRPRPRPLQKRKTLTGHLRSHPKRSVNLHLVGAKVSHIWNQGRSSRYNKIRILRTLFIIAIYIIKHHLVCLFGFMFSIIPIKYLILNLSTDLESQRRKLQNYLGSDLTKNHFTRNINLR